MSGFEIAGVVLGSIPLVVSTLENYKNGLRTIQRYRRYDREIQSLIRNLETERVKLQNLCEKLLDGLVPPSRIDAMVENPGGDLWFEEETQKKIRARLWKSWDVFEWTLRDIQTSIQEVYETLGNAADTKWSDKPLAIRELKRMSFALSRSTYTDQLTTIKDGISNLESLATMNIELEPKRRVRSRVRLLNILRDLGWSIYHAVCSSLKCSCKHRVSMRLSRCEDNIAYIDNEEVIQSLKFHLALSLDASQSHESQSTMTDSRQWEELLIRPNPSLQRPTQAPSLQSKTTESIIDSAKQRKKSVRFSMARFSSFSSTATTVQEKTTLVTNLVADMALEAARIASPGVESSTNLCSGLRTLPITERSGRLGVISDQSHTNTRAYTVYSSTRPSLEGHNWKMVSLREVLECHDGQPFLTYKQRLQLSVFVTTSVLQFYKTPWMPKIPSSQNIFFFQQGSFSDYENSFLVAEERDISDSEQKTLPIIQTPTLLALGVLLIELIQGHTIDSLQTPEEILSTDLRPLSTYTTAQRLLSEICQTSSNYGSAVRRCIDGEFQRSDLNAEDENFRHEFYCGVVALLEEDLDNL
ncbi:hypothetical protein FALBO_10464 [Fusarium albosuccineum]|uniref:DUF7580 domain-containing protein n=1 Tax=Fusarium albosuccineum TaxID=1237068 RepID=A0A8H4L5M1_9HYPO|nr:hypothetical protein FALBO_10464 [Fusarium albosuccineum]